MTDKNTGEQQYVEMTTRAPAKMQMYAKTLAFAKGQSLKVMFREAAERFFRDKPWEQGLSWRPTKGQTTTLRENMGQKEATGWMQVNMRFPVEIGNELARLATEQNVPLSSVCYTLLYWWTWWVYPPKSEQLRREEALLRRDSERPTEKPIEAKTLTELAAERGTPGNGDERPRV
jgi:hypothetical protein